MQEPTCAYCDGPMSPAAGPRIREYCSEKCRNRVKWERRKAAYHQERAAGLVPQIRRKQIARDRANGVRPQHTEELAECPICNAVFERGHIGRLYCSVACRRAAKTKRQREQRAPFRRDVVLAVLISGRPRKVIGTVIENGGLWVHCPDHPGRRVRMLITDHETGERACLCGVTFTLNQEEVSWVTYETLSMIQPRQAAS